MARKIVRGKSKWGVLRCWNLTFSELLQSSENRVSEA